MNDRRAPPRDPPPDETPEWRRYLPTAHERGPYRGPFSVYAEYHATIIGLAAGGTAGAVEAPMIAVGAVLLVLGIRSGVKMTNEIALREMRAEPWFAIAGITVGYLGGDATLRVLAVIAEWLAMLGAV